MHYTILRGLVADKTKKRDNKQHVAFNIIAIIAYVLYKYRYLTYLSIGIEV